MAQLLAALLVCSCLTVEGRALGGDKQSIEKEIVVDSNSKAKSSVSYNPDSYVDNHHNIPRQNFNSHGGSSEGDGGDDNGSG